MSSLRKKPSRPKVLINWLAHPEYEAFIREQIAKRPSKMSTIVTAMQLQFPELMSATYNALSKRVNLILTEQERVLPSKATLEHIKQAKIELARLHEQEERRKEMIGLEKEHAKEKEIREEYYNIFPTPPVDLFAYEKLSPSLDLLAHEELPHSPPKALFSLRPLTPLGPIISPPAALSPIGESPQGVSPIGEKSPPSFSPIKFLASPKQEVAVLCKEYSNNINLAITMPDGQVLCLDGNQLIQSGHRQVLDGEEYITLPQTQPLSVVTISQLYALADRGFGHATATLIGTRKKQIITKKIITWYIYHLEF